MQPALIFARPTSCNVSRSSDMERTISLSVGGMAEDAVVRRTVIERSVFLAQIME